MLSDRQHCLLQISLVQELGCYARGVLISGAVTVCRKGPSIIIFVMSKMLNALKTRS